MLVISDREAEKAVIDIYGHVFEMDVEKADFQKLFLEIQSQIYNNFDGGSVEKILEYISSGEFDNKVSFLRLKINDIIVSGSYDVVPAVFQYPTDYLPENKKSDFIFLTELYKSLTDEIQAVMNENAKKVISKV
jgi:hypothetical protein